MEDKKIKKIIKVIGCICLVLALAGCSSAPQDDRITEKTSIKLGTLSTFEPVMGWVAEAMKEKGLDVEVIVFDGNNLPAIALKDGDIDMLLNNHLPWIKTFNEENNCNLIMPKPYLLYGRFGFFSIKHTSFDTFPDGAVIVVPGDPTNMENALTLLASEGVIKLGEKKENFYTILDITENPKNIEILEAEISVTARSVTDADAVFCPAQRMAVAGYDPNVMLAELPNTTSLPQGFTVLDKDTEAQWLKTIQEYCATEEFKTKFNDYFKGSFLLFE